MCRRVAEIVQGKADLSSGSCDVNTVCALGEAVPWEMLSLILREVGLWACGRIWAPKSSRP